MNFRVLTLKNKFLDHLDKKLVRKKLSKKNLRYNNPNAAQNAQNAQYFFQASVQQIGKAQGFFPTSGSAVFREQSSLKRADAPMGQRR